MRMKKIQENIGELGDLPNEKYRQFFDKFSEINSFKIEEWKIVHLLGYFVQKYFETYQVQYQFKFNNPLPSKSFEVFQMKRLGIILTSNPSLLKEYIDWVFVNKIPQAKRRITSISFLTREEIVNEYKLNILLADKKDTKINRSTILPAIYQEIFGQAETDIRTYGDLAFFIQTSNKSIESQALLSKIKDLGFDEELLKQVV